VFTAAERRARLGVRHALAPAGRAGSVVDAARAVVVLHATDPASVVLSALARTGGEDPAAVEHALYEDRALVRVMGMRRTVFAAPAATAGVVTAACGREVAGRERRKLIGYVQEAGIAGGPAQAQAQAWVGEAERAALAALRGRGEATATELGEDDERLRAELVLGGGSRYEARVKVVSRVLTVLAAEGLVVRTRPRGSWTSTQVRWAPLDAWCPQALPVADVDAARASLARLWLRAFGPAFADDLRWWTGWGARVTAAALAGAGAVECQVEGRPGVVLPGDDPVAPVAAEPWVALLPALDPTTMGWRDRGFYLGPHAEALFDRNGNAAPTVWWDGRIVGGWAQRPDGEVAWHLLEDVGADAESAVAAAAQRLEGILGDVRLAPRARARCAVETALLAQGGAARPPRG